MLRRLWLILRLRWRFEPADGAGRNIWLATIADSWRNSHHLSHLPLPRKTLVSRWLRHSALAKGGVVDLTENQSCSATFGDDPFHDR